MTAPLLLDLRSPAECLPAKRQAAAALQIGRRVVAIVTHRGSRVLALHAIPFETEVVTIRGTNAMVSRSKTIEDAIAPAFYEARRMFAADAYKPDGLNR